MTDSDLRERIADQFSYRGGRSDVWRGFDLLFDTDAFLNLGYSPGYLPHFVGSSQRRLAGRIGSVLAGELSRTAGRPLLDVGCGRGGPAIELAKSYGFRVTGLDLVPYNVTEATGNARRERADVRFLVGDATAMPIAPDSMPAITAIDSLVYVPEREAAIDEIGTVLSPDGVAVISDLVTTGTATDHDEAVVDAFADAWDMPEPATVTEYERAVTAADLDLRRIDDVSRYSVARFRRWTGTFLALADGPAGDVLRWAIRRYGLDPAVVLGQIRCAHAALPHLAHVIVVARA